MRFGISFNFGRSFPVHISLCNLQTQGKRFSISIRKNSGFISLGKFLAKILQISSICFITATKPLWSVELILILLFFNKFIVSFLKLKHISEKTSPDLLLLLHSSMYCCAFNRYPLCLLLFSWLVNPFLIILLVLRWSIKASGKIKNKFSRILVIW